MHGAEFLDLEGVRSGNSVAGQDVTFWGGHVIFPEMTEKVV
jgi:hypothetical protein